MDNEHPKVSVLIPAYNSDKFIQRTVNSVTKQTFSDFEIVVVDDGSTDSTADIVRRLQSQDSRLRYFYQENQGLSKTRNRLVELARGEFVAFLDHDDEWIAGKLDKQLRLFVKDKNLGLVFSDAYIKNNGQLAGTCFKQRRPFRGDIFYKYLFSDNFVSLPTVLVPKNILMEFMPFKPEYEVAEEFDIFLKIARKYKFDYVDEPLAIYHLHGNNEVLSKWYKMIEEDFDILDYWRKVDPSIDKMHKDQLSKRFSQLYYTQGRCFLERSNLLQAKNSILNSFKHRLFNYGAFKLSIKLILGILKLGFK